MNEQTQAVIHSDEAIQAIGHGLLIFLPEGGEYRAVAGRRSVQASVVSDLLRDGMIEKTGSLAGVYKLTATGRAYLKEQDGIC